MISYAAPYIGTFLKLSRTKELIKTTSKVGRKGTVRVLGSVRPRTGYWCGPVANLVACLT